MEFVRKHPILSTTFGISLLGFFTSLIFLLLLHSDYIASNDALKKIRRSYNTLANVYPSPTIENLTLSEKNTEYLKNILLKKKNALIAENNIFSNNIKINGIELLANIQGFLQDFEEASTYQDSFGVEKKIRLPENEAFGFAKFAGSNTATPPDRNAPRLNLQLSILRYILSQLYAAQPISLVAIEREAVIELGSDKESLAPKTTRSLRKKLTRNSKKSQKSQDIFLVDPAITAKVPGSIETMGFKIVFTGYTSSLREFLVRIANFEIPLVIREIFVKPSLIENEGKDKAGSNSSKASLAENPFNQLFNDFKKSTDRKIGKNFDQSTVNQKPVVSNNESVFTVILEYIEVVTEIPESIANR